MFQPLMAQHYRIYHLSKDGKKTLCGMDIDRDKLQIAVVRDPSQGWIACVSWDDEEVAEQPLVDYIGRGCQCRSLDDLRRILATSRSYHDAADNIAVWVEKWIMYADSLLLDLETA